MSIQAHFVMKDKTVVCDTDGDPLLIDSCCWGNLSGLGRVFNSLKGYPLEEFGGIKLLLGEKSHYRQEYEKSTERRKLVDQIFTELRFDEWLEGLITKKYSKDKTVSSITFSPDSSIPLMVTASSVYRLTANCTYFLPIYNMARKLGIRPMLAYFVASNIQQVFDTIHSDKKRNIMYSSVKEKYQLFELDPKYIVREYAHSGHMPWNSNDMSVKAVKHLESLSTEHLQAKWASIYNVLKSKGVLSYAGRTAQFTPNSDYVRKPLHSVLKLKNTWKRTKADMDPYQYGSYSSIDLPREYVLNDILQATLKLQETEL